MLSKENLISIIAVIIIITVIAILLMIETNKEAKEYEQPSVIEKTNALPIKITPNISNTSQKTWKFKTELENATRFTDTELHKLSAEKNFIIKQMVGSEYKIVKIGCNSDSMGILFGCNDIVIMETVNNITELRQGDIIDFKFNETTKAIHRIIEINYTTGQIRTKGDNNPVPDPNNVTMSMGIKKCIGILYTGNYTLKVIS